MLLTAFSAAVLALLPAATSDAQREENWRRCADAQASTAIAGCTAIIDAGGGGIAPAFYNRGIAYRHAGQADRAIQDYDRAILLAPDDAEAFNNRGVAHDAIGQHDRAIADYDQAVRLRPGYAEAFYNRGNALRHRNLRDRAIRQEGQSTQQGGSDADRAIADYGQALRLQHDYAAAFNNRGVAHYEKGAFDRAIQDYDQAIRLRPDLAEAFNNRALAYLKLHRYDRAKADFDRTILLNQNYGNALINIALGASEAPARERAP